MVYGQLFEIEPGLQYKQQTNPCQQPLRGCVRSKCSVIAYIVFHPKYHYIGAKLPGGDFTVNLAENAHKKQIGCKSFYLKKFLGIRRK